MHSPSYDDYMDNLLTGYEETYESAPERTVDRDNRPEAVAQRKAEKTAQRASEARMEQYQSEALF